MAGKRRSVFAEQRYALAKRNTESALAKIINTAEGHKALDLPAGHQSYRILLQQAQKEIVKLQNKATKLGLDAPDYSLVAAKVPQLKSLEDMAKGTVTPQVGLPAKIVGGGIAGMLIATIITIIIAYCHDLYVVLTHLSWLPK